MNTLVFVDDVADLIEVSHATVVVLEKEHGIMDIIRWIEAGRIQTRNFGLVMFLIGRGDIKHSRAWLIASFRELFAVILSHNKEAQLALGAVIPSIQDSTADVREFLARNSVLHKTFGKNGDNSVTFCRPGKVLLAKGGPVANFFGLDGHLNFRGRRRLVAAIARDQSVMHRNQEVRKEQQWGKGYEECTEYAHSYKFNPRF